MKTFIFTEQAQKAKYGFKKTLEIYWVNNNFPTNVASITFYTGSTKGTISEAMQALVNAAIIDKKYDNSYYSDWNENERDFRLIGLNY